MTTKLSRHLDSSYPYHVALSFAGEDRDYVEKVAASLRSAGVAVFYDRYEEAFLWGKDLYVHLNDLYKNKAVYCVIFISANYAEKLWTRHECVSAQSRAFEENDEYILPARFDDTPIPGLNRTIGYIDLSNRSPAGFADLIISKLIMSKCFVLTNTDKPQKCALSEVIQLALRQFDSTQFDRTTPLGQNTQRDAERLASSYRSYCVDLYRNMRILAMARPVELSHIFTQARLTDKIRREKSKTESDILREIVSTASTVDDNTQNALSIIAKSQRTVLLGRPGSGKSTILKFALLKDIQSVAIDKIPILITLNQVERNRSLVESAERILSNAGFESPKPQLTELLKLGRVRLLIDGLDELRTEDRVKIIKEINDLMTTYTRNSFVITCRISAYEYWFGDCQHYEIQRFSSRSIFYFVIRWFGSDKKKAKELCTLIKGNTRILNLCGNPLMLTIVCIGFEAGIDISCNRAEIYKDAIEVLLKKWDASRSIYRDNVYRTLSPKRREDLLCDLAARTFVEDLIAIPARTAEKIVGEFLKTMPPDNESFPEEDGSIVLHAIETQHGLLEKKSLRARPGTY